MVPHDAAAGRRLARRGQNVRILNVDADGLRRERRCAGLGEALHNVTPAVDAAGAIAAALESSPDVVLIHDRVRDMDPIELARRFRLEPRLSGTIIIHLGAQSHGAPLAAFAAGVDLLVPSSLGDAELLRIVDAASERAFLIRQTARPTGNEPCAAPPEPAASNPRGAEARRQTTILLVDDERAIRRLAEGVLTRAGYAVQAHESSPAALAWWQHHHDEVLLVLTDVAMPGGTGLAMLARMRQDVPDLPAIVMSGYVAGDPGGIPAAPDIFMQKPFTPDELRTAVRERLARALQLGG